MKIYKKLSFKGPTLCKIFFTNVFQQEHCVYSLLINTQE